MTSAAGRPIRRLCGRHVSSVWFFALLSLLPISVPSLVSLSFGLFLGLLILSCPPDDALVLRRRLLWMARREKAAKILSLRLLLLLLLLLLLYAREVPRLHSAPRDLGVRYNSRHRLLAPRLLPRSLVQHISPRSSLRSPPPCVLLSMPSSGGAFDAASVAIPRRRAQSSDVRQRRHGRRRPLGRR